MASNKLIIILFIAAFFANSAFVGRLLRPLLPCDFDFAMNLL
ncbi:hypothetical protein [Streptococcus hyovaginalis]|nr:hypothetical protein [Streptococcus hyovaginalis]MDY3024956.1 hypothetical protein [Streptococcus hyovaginalis]